MHSGQFILASNKQQQQATSNKQQATSNKQKATSNKQQATSNKQQATAAGPKLDSSGTPMAQGPKLRPKHPLPKALLSTKFGPPTPWWRRSAATFRLKMAKNGPPEAKNGPKRGQNSPKWAQMPPKVTPNLGKRLRYVKPPYHQVFGPPTPWWRRSAATLQLKKWPKMAPWRPKWAQKGPTATGNKHVGFIRYLGYADRLRPKTWPEGAPS